MHISYGKDIEAQIYCHTQQWLLAHTHTADLPQMHVHELYRATFNSVDKANNKRQRGSSFEKHWRTHKWWLRDFQMLFGMSEVNAYLSIRHFVPGQQHLSLTLFRRRLVHHMLHHHVTQRERGERMLLRGQELAANTNDHLLMKMPTTTGSTRAQRIRCRACGTKTYRYCSCGGAPIPGKRSALAFAMPLKIPSVTLTIGGQGCAR